LAPDEQPASTHTDAIASPSLNTVVNLPKAAGLTAQRGHRFDKQISGELGSQRRKH
jgi:hypothetical protein